MPNPTNFNIYKWTDPGAPVVRDAGPTLSVGTQYAQVLDACLVSGYGAKSSAGWTKPYQSGDYHVYKMGANSSERYFQFYAKPASTNFSNSLYSWYGAYVNVFDAMTSATSGTGSIYSRDNYRAYDSGWNFGQITAGTADHYIPWVVVANSAGFYIWRPQTDSSYNSGTGGLGAYAKTGIGISGCIDILSYNIETKPRTLLLNDYKTYKRDYTIHPEDLVNTNNAVCPTFLTGAKPIHRWNPTSTTIGETLDGLGRVQLVSDDVFLNWYGNVGSTENWGAGPGQANSNLSKVYILECESSRVWSIVGEVPGLYRGTRHLNELVFYEGNNYLTFGNAVLGYAQLVNYIAIEKTGNWYGNPNIL